MKKLLMFGAIILAGCATQYEISTPQFDQAAMDTLLSEAVSSGTHVGVSALIFDEGQTVYTGAFGQRDQERDQPVELDTVFRIYSMSKPITSALILDLQEDGMLNLDDPVMKYIPELGGMMVASVGEDGKPVFTPQTTPMTVKDLMLHRSGIGYGIFGPVNPIEEMYEKASLFTRDEGLSKKMEKLSKLPLIAQPGEGWYYSYGIDVLGRIAEIASGESLDELLENRIFKPLEMTDTGFQVREDQKPRFASNYLLKDDNTYVLLEDGQTSLYLEPAVYQSGGGGLVSTLGDYANFAQMLLDGGIYNGHRILDESTVKTMTSNQLDADDKFLMSWIGESDSVGFGYGGSVQIADSPEQVAKDGRATGQYGWGGMARTQFWIDEPNDAFGIMMLQYLGQQEPALRESFRALTYAQTKDAQP
jgi:CubicO group peptidase (beta-lactamase class C family)